MASTYHPFYGSLWNDDKLEGLPFEAKGFFAYLFTNSRIRPSGIYRVNDAQLSVDTGLSVTKVRNYLKELDQRGLIVRDGWNLFVISYFKRQPKHTNLVRGVASDIAETSSVRVLEAFAHKYPAYSQRVADRRATVLVDAPASTEQSRAEQSRALTCPTVGPTVEPSTDQPPAASPAASPTHASISPSTTATPNGMPRRDRGALRAAARELLAFLNKKTNRNFQAVDTNLDPLIALLRKGRTPEQIRGVIAMRVARWLSDPDMSEFLRPSTLFKPRNFENYLGQLPASAFEAPQNA